MKGLSAVADKRCRTDKLDGVIKHRSFRKTTMVGRGASLDGRLILGGTDGSNPVPSSGESANHRFLSGTDPIQNLRYRQPGRTTVRLALYGTSNEYRGGGFGEGFELPTGIMRIGDLVPPSSSLRPSLLADEIGELFACHFSGHKQKHRRY